MNNYKGGSLFINTNFSQNEQSDYTNTLDDGLSLDFNFLEEDNNLEFDYIDITNQNIVKDIELVDNDLTGGNTRESSILLNNINNINKKLKFVDEDKYYTFTNRNVLSGNINYLNNGAYSVIFEIEDENNNKFILKCFYENYQNDEIYTNLLESYLKYKNNDYTKNNLLNIYNIGNLYDDNQVICQYLITDIYKNEEDIKELSFENKFNLFVQIYDFINLMRINNILYRDVKLKNVGMDNNNNFIILDFDKYTLIDYNKAQNINWLQECTELCPGTFLSYYIYNNLFIIDSDKLSINKIYDKINSLPLATIILELFFSNNDLLIYVLNRFKNYNTNFKINYDEIVNDINNLEFKYKDEYKGYFINMLDKLLKKEYDDINMDLENEINNINKILHSQQIIQDAQNINPNFNNKYYHKYLKYKNKYIQLKNKLEFN